MSNKFWSPLSDIKSNLILPVYYERRLETVQSSNGKQSKVHCKMDFYVLPVINFGWSVLLYDPPCSVFIKHGFYEQSRRANSLFYTAC